MNTSTRLWMTPTWATQSSGRTAAAAPSTSSPRTRRSWPSAGANARATARPWPIRRWRELWETTAAPVRSGKWGVNSLTSSTQTSCTGWALLRCTCPATLHQRRSTPSSRTRLNRATATAPQRQTGTAGTDTTSCRRTTTWPPASLHTVWPNSEPEDGLITEEKNLFQSEKGFQRLQCLGPCSVSAYYSCHKQ